MIEASGYNGQVQFDGETITISRKGFVARATLGKSEKRIPARQVTAVQFKPAGKLQRGFIQFSLSGGEERHSRFGKQTTDAMQDENSVVFTPKSSVDFEQLREAVQAALNTSESAPAPAATNGADKFDQLEKLAALHRDGVLTESEYSQQKAQLLNQ